MRIDAITFFVRTTRFLQNAKNYLYHNYYSNLPRHCKILPRKITEAEFSYTHIILDCQMTIKTNRKEKLICKLSN